MNWMLPMMNHHLWTLLANCPANAYHLWQNHHICNNTPSNSVYSSRHCAVCSMLNGVMHDHFHNVRIILGRNLSTSNFLYRKCTLFNLKKREKRKKKLVSWWGTKEREFSFHEFILHLPFFNRRHFKCISKCFIPWDKIFFDILSTWVLMSLRQRQR